MKRIVAFTLILALRLAGCGTQGAEGPVSSPGAETPPAPDGEAAAAFEAEALILARLYANGESGELFRLDFNGDGAEDLVLRKDGMRTSWMFIPGGSAPEPDIVFDLSAAGGMEVYYSESEDRLVIEKYYGSVGHSLEMYSLYDGVSFTEAASSEQGQDAPRPACVVDGVDATEAMYEARVEGLALAGLENGADINGPLSAGLPEGGYEAAAEYLRTQYGELLGMEEPRLNLYGGDYDIYGRQLYRLEFFEGAGSDLDRILHYNFTPVAFYCDDAGGLFLVRIWQPDLSQKMGDYPIITAGQARELLLEGHYITTVPYEMPGREYIRKVELVYRTGTQEEYYMPYYRFYAELPQEKRENGLNTYGAYYVPAVSGEYLTGMPTWDGSFN